MRIRPVFLLVLLKLSRESELTEECVRSRQTFFQRAFCRYKQQASLIMTRGGLFAIFPTALCIPLSLSPNNTLPWSDIQYHCLQCLSAHLNLTVSHISLFLSCSFSLAFEKLNKKKKTEKKKVKSWLAGVFFKRMFRTKRVMQGLLHFDVNRLLHFCYNICCECGTVVICKIR